MISNKGEIYGELLMKKLIAAFHAGIDVDLLVHLHWR